MIFSKASLLVTCIASASAFQLHPQHGRRVSTTSLFAKNILVCFDGTGNDALGQLPDYEEDQTFSNVLKLHILGGGAIDPDVEYQALEDKGQISLYEVGCGSKEDMDTKFIESANLLLGDLSKQIDPMKERLGAVYEEGDKLFVFGFSRGAASARLFSSQLAKDGLKVGDKVIDSPPIAILGCYDTVAMQFKTDFTGVMGDWLKEELPSCTAIGEHDFKVAPNVEKAVHLLSLDDNRQFNQGTYPPTLMGTESRVDELWMAGVHSDIGGWWINKNGLSDISLDYMMKACKEKGLIFLEAGEVAAEAVTIQVSRREVWEMQEDKKPLMIDTGGEQVNHQSTRNLRRPSPRPIYVAKNDAVLEGVKPRIHVSAADHILNAAEDDLVLNPFFEDLDFDVVGDDGKVLSDKTAALKSFVKEELVKETFWDKWRS